MDSTGPAYPSPQPGLEGLIRPRLEEPTAKGVHCDRSDVVLVQGVDEGHPQRDVDTSYCDLIETQSEVDEGVRRRDGPFAVELVRVVYEDIVHVASHCLCPPEARVHSKAGLDPVGSNPRDRISREIVLADAVLGELGVRVRISHISPE